MLAQGAGLAVKVVVDWVVWHGGAFWAFGGLGVLSGDGWIVAWRVASRCGGATGDGDEAAYSISPEIIVMELGDGLLGTYGVDTILADDVVRGALSCVVLCANDPVAAWGGVKILRDDYAIEPTVVTGPSTDNAVGVDLIKAQLGVDAHNALTEGQSLGDSVYNALGFPS